jgi:hypothetical protein
VVAVDPDQAFCLALLERGQVVVAEALLGAVLYNRTTRVSFEIANMAKALALTALMPRVSRSLRTAELGSVHRVRRVRVRLRSAQHCGIVAEQCTNDLDLLGADPPRDLCATTNTNVRATWARAGTAASNSPDIM